MSDWGGGERYFVESRKPRRMNICAVVLDAGSLGLPVQKRDEAIGAVLSRKHVGDAQTVVR